MTQVLVVAIWDKDAEKVLTRSIVVDAYTKELKLNGKKPNKIIVPESCKNGKLLKKIKKIGCYGCKIVKAVGK